MFFWLVVYIAEELLEHCIKDQFLKTAEHCEMEVPDKHLKDTMKTVVKNNLLEAEVHPYYPYL